MQNAENELQTLAKTFQNKQMEIIWRDNKEILVKLLLRVS